jgi:hypothetical protein
MSPVTCGTITPEPDGTRRQQHGTYGEAVIVCDESCATNCALLQTKSSGAVDEAVTVQRATTSYRAAQCRHDAASDSSYHRWLGKLDRASPTR